MIDLFLERKLENSMKIWEKMNGIINLFEMACQGPRNYPLLTDWFEHWDDHSSKYRLILCLNMFCTHIIFSTKKINENKYDNKLLNFKLLVKYFILLLWFTLLARVFEVARQQSVCRSCRAQIKMGSRRQRIATVKVEGEY